MKIAIIGSGPFNSKNGIRNAGSLRTFQFFSAAEKSGANILLITIENDKKKLVRNKKKNLIHLSIDKNQRGILRYIRKEIKSFKPDAIIGVNTMPSFIVAKVVDLQMPFWADLNGWAMSEIQAQAKAAGTNAFIPRIYQIEKSILKKADKISTVSTPQKYAVLGELAFTGRLKKENFHYNFLEVIPNWTLKEKNEVKTIEKKIIELPKNAFLIGQIGGFNAWLDEETLFKSLKNAITKNPNIHFAATGGAIKHVDEKTYLKFCERVRNSKFKNHFHLLGWVKNEDIPNIYKQIDCIINVDFDCAETWTGARNRLNEALINEKPIITTLGSEIANDLEKHGAALTAKNGEISGLSKAILILANNNDISKELVLKSKNLLKNKYSLQYTTASFSNWIVNPQKAPKNSEPIKLKNEYLRSGIIYLRQRGIKSFMQKIWQKINN